MKLLLNRSLLLHPSDNKTNVEIPFVLTREYHALWIRTEYEPKTVADREFARRQIEAGIERYIPESARERWGHWENYLPLVNFVTLSLDHGDAYIGCAHRHSPVQDHIISAVYSSPGFIRYSVLPGEWRCVLNCHAVVDDTVTYSLTVYGTEEGEEVHDHIQAF